MKRKFGLLEENSSSKQDKSDIQDSSDKEGISNKQLRSKKQDSSSKHVSSNKQVRSNKHSGYTKKGSSNELDSSKNLKNLDPDCLMKKFSELYNSKYDSDEKAQAAREQAIEILDELLRVKALAKKQYNTLFKNVKSN